MDSKALIYLMFLCNTILYSTKQNMLAYFLSIFQEKSYFKSLRIYDLQC